MLLLAAFPGADPAGSFTAAQERPISTLFVDWRRGSFSPVADISARRSARTQRCVAGFQFCASCNEKGYGVPHNGVVAASWYQKSANQGDPDGQLALGRLYFEGDGVARNLVEAYKWMYLAGRGTSKAFAYLRVIGNLLTYDQMSEATDELLVSAFHSFWSFGYRPFPALLEHWHPFWPFPRPMRHSQQLHPLGHHLKCERCGQEAARLIVLPPRLWLSAAPALSPRLEPAWASPAQAPEVRPVQQRASPAARPRRRSS